jgi:hypothetical protein
MAKSVAILGLFALLVVIIVGISLAVYFNTKKSGDGETSDKPELTFDANAKKTINPQEGEDNGTQEGYAIEYAEGDDSSKFIDLTLSWTNGSGFDSVSKLIFTRYVGTTKIQTDQEVTEESALADYGTGSVTFKGADVTEGVDVKGTNIIKAYYNEVSPDNLLATAELGISDDDFSYTLAGPFGDLDVKVTISSETFKLTKSVKKTYYQISHAPGQWFNVNQNSNGTIKFKFDDGTFLKFGDKDTFKLAKYKTKKMLTNTDGHVWVHNKQAWKPVGNLDKDDFRFAQCDLFGANTIMRSGDKALTPSDKLWKSPNGEWGAVYQESDGNFVVYNKITEGMTQEEREKNTVSAYASSNGSFNLTLSENGNIAFKKGADELIKSSGGHTFSTKQGLKPPFTFMVSDFGGLHVISKEGTEVMSRSNQFFGTYSNYHKTHAGDLWGFSIGTHHGSSFGLCADECDKNLYCAGFTHNYTNNNCWVKGYDARILGVASNNKKNADRWSNTKENGGTNWVGDQYYQKKIDTNCYADRYSDLKAAFGDKSVNLRDHYFNHGISEGRDATCDTTQPVNSKKGYYPDPNVKYFSNEFDTTKSVGWEGCKDAVKAKGFEIWGVRGANNRSNSSNTCFGYKKGAAATELEGGESPIHHFTGCVNGKTLESGCTQ